MLFSVSRSLVQMNREKSVKYCGSDGEELSLEAGEVCDVEERRAAVGNTKCLQGATQRVIQPEGGGGMKGGAGHRREGWGPSVERTRSLTRGAAHT